MKIFFNHSRIIMSLYILKNTLKQFENQIPIQIQVRIESNQTSRTSHLLPIAK